VLLLGGLACLFCVFQLRDLVSALVVIRILLLFLLQAVGAVVWRIANPTQPRPFRMWLYPLPALLASAGFLFILISRKNFLREIRYAAVILAVGLTIYMVRSWRNGEWPFAEAVQD